MAEFTIRFRGNRAQLKAQITRLPSILQQASTASSRTALARVGNATLKVVYDAFKVKARGRTDQAGQKWQKTVRKKVYPHGILVERGILRSSLQPNKDPAQIGHTIYQVFRIGQGGVSVGTAQPFAMVHHKGKGKIPRRRLWPELRLWPPPWKQAILSAAARGCVDVLREILR